VIVERIVARPLPGLVPVRDLRGALRILIASLTPGGAERIVLEWAGAELARGREVELAVLHPRRHTIATPPGLRLRARDRDEPELFLAALASDWSLAAAPVSTHLISDAHLAILWNAGVRTVPTVHNSRPGWRNDPRAWTRENVPMAIACAESVRKEILAAGCGVPVVTLRHSPRVGSAALDRELRRGIRAQLGVGEATFLIGAVGAIKRQKDYPRAIEVLARLAGRRDAALAILGGALDGDGLAELDRVVARAVSLGVAARLKLPGFVPVIEPYLAACDALVNVSRFEGLSIATQDALAAGLPVVAREVGGQGEIEHPALELVDARADPDEFARRLARHPVRAVLAAAPVARAPRAASLALAHRSCRGARIDTLFVTANLNAGGAQRSLANLAASLAGCHPCAVAVCGESTTDHFAGVMRDAGVELVRPSADSDPIALAESLVAQALSRGAATVCFWNADARVKLALAKFAPAGLRIVDVSPGAYAFTEMEEAERFARSIAYSGAQFHERLDALVLKYRAATHLPCKRVEVIPNGVALRAARGAAPAHPRFLASGRIAPSKRLEIIIAAFRRIAAHDADAELCIVGPVEERHADYARGVVRAAAGLAVRFHGASPGLAHLDEPFTAAIVLGTHQGSPNAVLEAMAAGIAVIANDSGGTRELVEDGVTGWLLAEDAGDEALAAAMAEAIAQPRERASRAAGVLERVRGAHSLEAMARDYLAVLDAGSVPGREKMDAWNIASAPVAPHPSRHAPSPATALP
jgi:glycosyltransferase involved in cell wall biosynthesis